MPCAKRCPHYPATLSRVGENATDQFGSKRLLHQLTQLVHYLRNIEIKIKTKIVIQKTIFVINIIIYTCNILMFCEFKIAVYLSLRERICSPKEFAPLRILNLLIKEFAPLRIFCKFVFT